jgi:hypothetical protein
MPSQQREHLRDLLSCSGLLVLCFVLGLVPGGLGIGERAGALLHVCVCVVGGLLLTGTCAVRALSICYSRGSR